MTTTMPQLVSLEKSGNPSKSESKLKTASTTAATAAAKQLESESNIELLKFRCEDIAAQILVHLELDLELLYGARMTKKTEPIQFNCQGFPAGLPTWMTRVEWGCTRQQELYRGRGIELLVTSGDPDLREEHDTPRFSVSWGVAYASSKEEEEKQLEAEDDIGCSGVCCTEDWNEALAAIRVHSAS